MANKEAFSKESLDKMYNRWADFCMIELGFSPEKTHEEASLYVRCYMRQHLVEDEDSYNWMPPHGPN